MVSLVGAFSVIVKSSQTFVYPPFQALFLTVDGGCERRQQPRGHGPLESLTHPLLVWPGTSSHRETMGSETNQTLAVVLSHDNTFVPSCSLSSFTLLIASFVIYGYMDIDRVLHSYLFTTRTQPVSQLLSSFNHGNILQMQEWQLQESLTETVKLETR